MVKGETVMPVPEGNITTSEILIPVEPVDAFAEINNAELAAYDAAMADASEKAEEVVEVVEEETKDED
jgi:hypothetical protein